MMEEKPTTAEEWIDREDRLCRQERIDRLEWLMANNPPLDYTLFPGGIVTEQLFEEARHCFVYAHFLASIFLSLAFIERVLASLFYSAGREDLRRAGTAKLANEAKNLGLISGHEFKALEELRQRRNPLAHFREPGHRETAEYRSGWIFYTEDNSSMTPQDVIANDAVLALKLVLRLLKRLYTSEALARFMTSAKRHSDPGSAGAEPRPRERT